MSLNVKKSIFKELVMWAAMMACCVVTVARAKGASSHDQETPLSLGPRTTPSKESHPRLLLCPDQANLYQQRIADMPEKTRTFGITTDVMLASLIDYTAAAMKSPYNTRSSSGRSRSPFVTCVTASL